MIIGVSVERHPKESRVALVPALVPDLVKAGLEVLVEPGAGVKAGFLDVAYEEHGARFAADRTELFSSADVLFLVHGLHVNSEAGADDLKLLRSGQMMVGLLNPLGAPEAALQLADKGITAFALELLPRIARSQPMDALSSMATVAGYKAVLLAAGALNKLYPMMITAAGTITPARVLVVGAGVAGLQAIATSRRLGAVVRAYDVRPAVREQVESLGAKFVELELETEEAETTGGYAQAMGEEFYRRQREMMKRVVVESDVVITTAAIPGKKSPVLITEEMVKGMEPGSVIVDLAAEGGGNCELTKPGKTIEAHHVIIMGPENVASTIPYHASQMYAKNLTAFLKNMTDDGELRIDLKDQIIRDSLLTHKGEVVNPRVRELLGLSGSSSLEEERSNA
ncbi:MAG: Re/Si-specific NAD(P)(+) transhydrogenase subunit alpha [Candidatus Marinimicrobia bacterium]|nr:Re/Si-specific NAD(P)(+) transhydrogenase subunit alpha [Candidatus Neomarinimicrobiota bacterium]